MLPIQRPSGSGLDPGLIATVSFEKVVAVKYRLVMERALRFAVLKLTRINYISYSSVGLGSVCI